MTYIKRSLEETIKLFPKMFPSWHSSCPNEIASLEAYAKLGNVTKTGFEAIYEKAPTVSVPPLRTHAQKIRELGEAYGASEEAIQRGIIDEHHKAKYGHTIEEAREEIAKHQLRIEHFERGAKHDQHLLKMQNEEIIKLQQQLRQERKYTTVLLREHKTHSAVAQAPGIKPKLTFYCDGDE